MNDNILFGVVLAISVFGLFFCCNWVKESVGVKEKIRSIMSLSACILLIPMMIIALLINNNII